MHYYIVFYYYPIQTEGSLFILDALLLLEVALSDLCGEMGLA